MIRCLCTVLYLAQSLMDILRCLTDGLCKQLICHKMRAGTGRQKSAVLYKTHCTEIDLTVSLDGIFTELLDFVNAGGSSTTTSNFSPFSSSSGRSSKTSSQRNFTVPSRPFRLAFRLACRTAVSDASTPRTLCAPAIPAFRAKEPVCVKQSRTFAPCRVSG